DGGGPSGEIRRITEEIARSDPRVQWLDAPGSVAQSRNTALARVDSEFVAFLDADEIAPADWLAHLLAPFSDPAVGFTGRSDARSRGFGPWPRGPVLRRVPAPLLRCGRPSPPPRSPDGKLGVAHGGLRSVRSARHDPLSRRGQRGPRHGRSGPQDRLEGRVRPRSVRRARLFGLDLLEAPAQAIALRVRRVRPVATAGQHLRGVGVAPRAVCSAARARRSRGDPPRTGADSDHGGDPARHRCDRTGPPRARAHGPGVRLGSDLSRDAIPGVRDSPPMGDPVGSGPGLVAIRLERTTAGRRGDRGRLSGVGQTLNGMRPRRGDVPPRIGIVDAGQVRRTRATRVRALGRGRWPHRSHRCDERGNRPEGDRDPAERPNIRPTAAPHRGGVLPCGDRKRSRECHDRRG
ncbi:Glycosyl transferase, family 2 domain protein, partial [mine drainage metagenome]